MKTVVVLLLFVTSALLSGCETLARGSNADHACYDLRGRIEPTIRTQAECEFHSWSWQAH